MCDRMRPRQFQDALSKAPEFAWDGPQVRARVACRSASPTSLLPAAYDSRSPTVVPRCDREFVATGRDGRQRDATDVQPKPIRLDLDGRGSDLAVTEPARWIVGRRINGRAVHCDAGIPSEILRPHRSGHHAQVDFPVVCEVDLGSADTRRTIALHRRHRRVLPHRERFHGPFAPGPILSLRTGPMNSPSRQ